MDGKKNPFLKRVMKTKSSEFLDLIEDHDYQFEWDYDVIEPDAEFKSTVTEVIKDIKKDTKGIIPDFTVGYVKGTGKLGKYIDGTSSRPMIALDVDSILASIKKYNVYLDGG